MRIKNTNNKVRNSVKSERFKLKTLYSSFFYSEF